MKPNLSSGGRWVRALVGVVTAGGGVYVGMAIHPWLGMVLVVIGGFALFEAVRGWCMLKACGIKTRF